MKHECCSSREPKFLGQQGKMHISHGLDVGPEVGSWSDFLIKRTLFKGSACIEIEGYTTDDPGLREGVTDGHAEEALLPSKGP